MVSCVAVQCYLHVNEYIYLLCCLMRDGYFRPVGKFNSLTIIINNLELQWTTKNMMFIPLKSGIK
jgi:hypothetical protein